MTDFFNESFTKKKCLLRKNKLLLHSLKRKEKIEKLFRELEANFR